MEQTSIKEWERAHGIKLGPGKADLLSEYAELIYHANKRFNLTGFTSRNDILIKLILACIEPLAGFNVPRGTRFADVGSGAGIPGIPLAIFFNELQGTLIDSNNKKICFIQKTVRDLGLDAVVAIQGRVEALARERFRNMFDFVFARAFAHLSVVVEMAAPMIIPGGLLYVYTNDREEDLSEAGINHIKRLGLSAVSRVEYGGYGLKDANMLLKKTGPTEDIYPRRVSVIKRTAAKFFN